MARVLIADDEVDLVEILAEIVREHGHEVRTVLDGVDALRTILSWHPEVALLDIDMPGLSGPAVAAELSRSGAPCERTALVLLSGNADVDRVGATAGITRCVTKPVGLDRLLDTIDAAVTDVHAAPG